MNQIPTTLLLTLVLLVGCRNASHQSGEQANIGDTITRTDNMAAKQEADDSVGREAQLLSPERLNSMSYEDKVRNIYSTEKMRIPKQMMDSAMKLKDPNKINKILENYMNQQDSGVRANIAVKLGISRDSLNKILNVKPRK